MRHQCTVIFYKGLCDLCSLPRSKLLTPEISEPLSVILLRYGNVNNAVDTFLLSSLIPPVSWRMGNCFSGLIYFLLVKYARDIIYEKCYTYGSAHCVMSGVVWVICTLCLKHILAHISEIWIRRMECKIWPIFSLLVYIFLYLRFLTVKSRLRNYNKDIVTDFPVSHSICVL